MDVVSYCPLRVASLAVQVARWRWALTVVAKATFRLTPVTCVLADEQEDPNEHENHWDDDPRRSVYSPSDLVPFKPRPEVTLVGNAFAPKHEAVSRLLVRLVVGNVDKSIAIHGERSFTQDGALRMGARFTRMPLRYERAAGGPDTRNPVGMARVADALGVVHLPNLEPPGLNVTRPDDVIEPVGFAPIAADWPTRRERLAGRWSPEALAVEPLPEWLDPRFFLAAPPDQYLDELRPNERIVLEGLHPDHPRLMTSLPGWEPRAFVERPRAASAELPMTCDTLWIDTDRSICTLTWRGRFALDERDQEGRVVVGMERQGRALSYAELLASRGAREQTLTGAQKRRATAPFAQQGEPAWPSWLPSPDARSAADQGGGKPVTGPPPAQASGDPRGAPDAKVSPPEPLKPLPPRPSRPPQHPATSTAPMLPAAPRPPSALGSLAETPFQPARPPLPPAPTVPRPASQAGSASPHPASQVGSASAHPAPVAPEVPPPMFAAPPLTMGQRVAAGVAPEAPSLARSMALRAPPSPSSLPPAPAREHVDLLWFDASAVTRITGDKAFSVGRTGRPAVTWLSGEAALREPAEVKERREIQAIFGRVTALDEQGLTAITDASYQPDGTFAAPLAFVAGELTFAFDELETLRATITVVSPFAGNDKKLKDAVQSGTDALKSEWGLTTDVAEGLTRRIEEAFVQGQRSVAPSYLEQSVEKILLEGRRYQKKNLLGAARVRALFTCAPEGAAIPTYLPEAAVPKLPLFRRFKVKAIVEVRPQEDQYETHPDALMLLAVGRVLRRG